VTTPESVAQKNKSLIKQSTQDDAEVEQSDFNTKLTNKNKKQFSNVTSTLMKSKSGEFDTTDLARNLKKTLLFQNSTEQAPSEINTQDAIGQHDSLVTSIIAEESNKNDEQEAAFESAETIQLFEKVLFIIYRLNWEGIVGSSEEIWKVKY
jgi:hypothetical protein